MGIPALSGQSEGGRGGRWHTLVPGLMKAIDGPKDWKEGPGPPSLRPTRTRLPLLHILVFAILFYTSSLYTNMLVPVDEKRRDWFITLLL